MTMILDQTVFTGKLRQLKYNWNSFRKLFPTVGNREGLQLMMTSSVAVGQTWWWWTSGQHVDMWMSQVCTLPFSSQQEPNAEKSFRARYHTAALSFRHKSWRSAPFLMCSPALKVRKCSFCPPIIGVVFRYRAGLYQRQLLRLWWNDGLDLSGARVDDKCDSSCHCGMLGLMTVLLIGWTVSSCGTSSSQVASPLLIWAT